MFSNQNDIFFGDRWVNVAGEFGMESMTLQTRHVARIQEAFTPPAQLLPVGYHQMRQAERIM